jgi:hypothetical protein
LLGEFGLVLVGEDQAAALDARDVLVGVEAERHEIAQGPDAPAPPGAAEGLGGVLDDAKPVGLGEGVEAVAVHRQAGEVHRQNRAGRGGDGGRHAVEVEVARDRIDVDEDRPGADGEDDVAGGHPGERRGDDLVAGADPGQAQGDLHRARAGVEDARRPAAANSVSLASKAFTCGPEVIQPERRTSATPAMVSSSMVGRVKGKKGSAPSTGSEPAGMEVGRDGPNAPSGWPDGRFGEGGATGLGSVLEWEELTVGC